MDGSNFNVNDQILEGLRPNFFELLSEEAMHEALRPAFQYLIKVTCKHCFTLKTHQLCRPLLFQVLAQSRPDLFATLWRFSDEVFLMFESLLQLHFIRRYC